jgi:hypothetical protein
MASQETVLRTKITRLCALLSLAAASGTTIGTANAQQVEEKNNLVIVETGPLEEGDVFGCRIPATARATTADTLTDYSIIVAGYGDDRRLRSSGITLERANLRTPTEDGAEVMPVPRQFEFTAEDCFALEGIEIVSAYCEFDNAEPKNCLDRIRFAGADPKRPRYLSVSAN